MAERKKLLLRLDPAVYDAVAKWAGDDLRSVNAQIEYALRLALKGAGRSPRAGRAPEPDQFGGAPEPDRIGRAPQPDRTGGDPD
ncbi:MAG TPA: hypothetical protein VGJ07_10010 [Rugosimonospora sp.]|jgi:hypothetical protein